MKRYRIGIVGYGAMGREWVKHLRDHPSWEVVSICDVSPASRADAQTLDPRLRVVADEEAVLSDPSIDVVGLFTLADSRPRHVRRTIASRKHVICEKPLAADVDTEWRLLEEIESSGLLVGVNLFNRNAWYHREMQAFIASGEIGEVAVLRSNHLTPGRVPGEGHAPEGPPFHDCGMHYVDVVRWYAQSEFRSWHAQGLCLWQHPEPWWVQVHGVFENGIVFEVTQGFIYGQLAKDHTFHAGLEIIGTRGVVRMEHDFETVTLKMNGTSRTAQRTGPYGGKKLDVFVDLFARSLDEGRNLGFPTPRDAVIASAISHEMTQAAIDRAPPMKGPASDLEQIRARHRALREAAGVR